MKSIPICFLIVTLQGCMTAMGPSEISGLTTCKGTDLQTIRKNLLLAGYGIKTAGAEDITTEFRQVSGSNGSRVLVAATVVQVNPSEFRFRLVRRKEFIREVKTNSTKIIKGKENHEKVVEIQQTSAIPATDERRISYYVEERDQHLQTQQEICGGV